MGDLDAALERVRRRAAPAVPARPGGRSAVALVALCEDFLARMEPHGTPGALRFPQPRRGLRRRTVVAWALTYDLGESSRSLLLSADGRIARHGADEFQPVGATPLALDAGQIETLADSMAQVLIDAESSVRD